MENPIRMDDLGGYPYFWKHPYDFWGLISNFSDFGSADREMIFEQPGRTRLFNGRTLAWISPMGLEVRMVVRVKVDRMLAMKDDVKHL